MKYIKSALTFAQQAALIQSRSLVASAADIEARLHKLLVDYPDIPRASMGFPANWDTCPIWK